MAVNFTPRLKLRRITSEKLSPGSFTFLNSSYTSSEMAIVLAMLYRRGERIHMAYLYNESTDGYNLPKTAVAIVDGSQLKCTVHIDYRETKVPGPTLAIQLGD